MAFALALAMAVVGAEAHPTPSVRARFIGYMRGRELPVQGQELVFAPR